MVDEQGLSSISCLVMVESRPVRGDTDATGVLGDVFDGVDNASRFGNVTMSLDHRARAFELPQHRASELVSSVDVHAHQCAAVRTSCFESVAASVGATTRPPGQIGGHAASRISACAAQGAAIPVGSSASAAGGAVIPDGDLVVGSAAVAARSNSRSSVSGSGEGGKVMSDRGRVSVGSSMRKAGTATGAQQGARAKNGNCSTGFNKAMEGQRNRNRKQKP
jgi:hypothetical protein